MIYLNFSIHPCHHKFALTFEFYTDLLILSGQSLNRDNDLMQSVVVIEAQHELRPVSTFGKLNTIFGRTNHVPVVMSFFLFVC